MRLYALMPTLVVGVVLCGGCGDEKENKLKARKDAGTHVPALEPEPVAAASVDCGTVPPSLLISISDRQLSQNPARIKAGEVVQWVNHDALPHSVTSRHAQDENSNQLFDSGTLQKGESTCVQFNKPGSYLYFCTSHADGNGGSVEVVAE